METTNTPNTKSRCGRFHICIIGAEGSKPKVIPHTEYNQYILTLAPKEEKKKFGIEVKNYHSLPCIFQLKYQGVSIGEWILKPYQSAKLYHPVGDRSAFEVSRVDSAHGQKLGFKEKDELNGKIDVKVTWKKQARSIIYRGGASQQYRAAAASDTLRGDVAVPHYMSASANPAPQMMSSGEAPITQQVHRGAVTEAGLGFSAETTQQDHYQEGARFTLDESTTDHFAIRLLIETLKAREAKSVAEYAEEQRKRQAPPLHEMKWS
jgi:hypothetical protein